MRATGFPFTAIPGSQVKSSKIPRRHPDRLLARTGRQWEYVWATQCFVDELAHAAGREPLAFTLDLLAATSTPDRSGFDAARMTTVLKLATEKAGWGHRARAARDRASRSRGPWVRTSPSSPMSS